MCSILGYVGAGSACDFLFEGFKKLEYKGFDALGVAVLKKDGTLSRYAGGIAGLEAEMARGLCGSMAIGHTQWLGGPSHEDAYPLMHPGKGIALVHNGVIENYGEISDWLSQRGHRSAMKDMEVVSHLIGEYYQEDGELARATGRAVCRLKGFCSFAVMAKGKPDYLVAVGGPLVVGLGEGENYLASEVSAVLRRTQNTYVLEDGEMAVISRNQVRVLDLEGVVRDKRVFQVPWDEVLAERNGYPHFMLKEIHEQPVALRNVLTGRITGDRVVLPEVSLDKIDFEKGRLFIVACGSSYHAGLVGKYCLEQLARVPVEVELASEFRYRDPIAPAGSGLIVISQSGETADTLGALREGKARGMHTTAITNVAGSSIALEADDVIYTRAGPEIAVASTKTYTTQIVALALFAAKVAETKGRVDTGFLEALRGLPAVTKEALNSEGQVQEVADKIAQWDDVFFLGWGPDFASAREGQLKLKEASYIHAEACAVGELKHGTLALIGEGIPVVALATQESVFENTLNIIREVRERGGWVTALVSCEEDVTESADAVLRVPKTHPLLAPVIGAIPLQQLAYYAAIKRGRNVDKPRNLTKSVVEEY